MGRGATPDWDRSFEEIESEIDPGIWYTIKFLMDNGFYVAESSDGSSDGVEWNIQSSYVKMLCENEYIITESMRLSRLLTEMGLDTAGHSSQDGDSPHIEAVFTPKDSYAAIYLYYVNDKNLVSAMEEMGIDCQNW